MIFLQKTVPPPTGDLRVWNSSGEQEFPTNLADSVRLAFPAKT